MLLGMQYLQFVVGTPTPLTYAILICNIIISLCILTRLMITTQALLEKLQGPNEPKYSVAYISIEFEGENVVLDIPHSEAEKQGYSISSSVEPCLVMNDNYNNTL